MKKIIYHPLAIIFLSILALYSIFSLRKSLEKINISRENLANIKNQVDQLGSEVEDKEQKLQQAQKNYSKEKITRDELLLKKPGEYVIQLPELGVEKKETGSSLSPKPSRQWANLLLN